MPFRKRHHLIWAVTGAGKTEMLYPILVETLKAGGRVAICTPRVDVCNELFLRYRYVFPEEKSRCSMGIQQRLIPLLLLLSVRFISYTVFIGPLI